MAEEGDRAGSRVGNRHPRAEEPAEEPAPQNSPLAAQRWRVFTGELAKAIAAFAAGVRATWTFVHGVLNDLAALWRGFDKFERILVIVTVAAVIGVPMVLRFGDVSIDTRPDTPQQADNATKKDTPKVDPEKIGSATDEPEKKDTPKDDLMKIGAATEDLKNIEGTATDEGETTEGQAAVKPVPIEPVPPPPDPADCVLRGMKVGEWRNFAAGQRKKDEYEWRSIVTSPSARCEFHICADRLTPNGDSLNMLVRVAPSPRTPAKDWPQEQSVVFGKDTCETYTGYGFAVTTDTINLDGERALGRWTGFLSR